MQMHAFEHQQPPNLPHNAHLQVDIFIDETYVVDPTSYHLKDFLLQYGFPTNASQQATYPFLANNTVYREDGLLSPTLGLDWYEFVFVNGFARFRNML